jgi:hypothetical protein
MATKRVTISTKPSGDPRADAWVRNRAERVASAVPTKGDLYTARLTIDVTPTLRGRIKVAAFQQGITLADLVRALLEREFPDETMRTPP